MIRQDRELARAEAVTIARYSPSMSNRHLFARAALIVGLVLAVTGSLLALNPLPAGAHAIVDLQSSDAIAAVATFT